MGAGQGGRRAQPPVGEGSADQAMLTARRTPLLSGPLPAREKAAPNFCLLSRAGLEPALSVAEGFLFRSPFLLSFSSRRGEESRLHSSPLPAWERIEGEGPYTARSFARDS
jgi:hypothetical protein